MGRKKRGKQIFPVQIPGLVQDESDQIPQVDGIVTTCPKCQSIHREVTNSVSFPNRPLKIHTGEIITGMRIQYATCADCGQRYRIRMPLVEKTRILK